MASTDVHAWPIGRLRARERAKTRAAAESISFPELVWAHFLRQRELKQTGDLHGPREAEYRRRLDEFVREHGAVVNAYWCTSEASAVALTQRSTRRFLWRRESNIRFHAATDWITNDAPDIAHTLHTCETLAIRVSEVLAGTSERIAMQWILSVAGYLLGIVDQATGKPSAGEMRAACRRAKLELARVEAYYDRAGEKTARLVYFGGMMLGIAAVAVLALIMAGGAWAFGTFHPHRPATEAFFTCFAMGAIGALASVMIRMASGSKGSFHVDYEVGRHAIRRLGAFRPVIGAIFALVLYFALRGGLLQISLTTGKRPLSFYAALAFLAGFSERRAKIILGGAERVLGVPEGEDVNAPPNERRRGSRPPSAQAQTPPPQTD